LHAAETARAAATGLEEPHRSELAEAHAKAREEIARSQVAAQGKSSERTAELGKTLAKRIADAEERVEQAKREALAEIETVAADAARDIVRRVAGIDVAEKDARAALAGARS
jgi:F-type H+-transporting ATPase subunit b